MSLQISEQSFAVHKITQNNPVPFSSHRYYNCYTAWFSDWYTPAEYCVDKASGLRRIGRSLNITPAPFSLCTYLQQSIFSMLHVGGFCIIHLVPLGVIGPMLLFPADVIVRRPDVLWFSIPHPRF